MSNEYDLVYYLVTGFTEEQFEHPDDAIREQAYINLNWPEKAKYDSNLYFVEQYYRHHNYPADAFDHERSDIRGEAYAHFNWPEKAKYDECSWIRQEYYRYHGYTKEALNDPSGDVILEAYEYFELKKKLKLVNKIQKHLTLKEKDYLKQLLEKNDE